jgi:hypothetical protein
MSPLATVAVRDLSAVMLTKAGKVKSRWSLDAKLELLSANGSRKETKLLLEMYQRLFAFRSSNGIYTRKGQGPSAWSAYRGIVWHDEVARHLLADQIPGRDPVWFGTRTFESSRYICLDVDADRTPERLLAKKCPMWEEMPEDIRATALAQTAAQLTRQRPRPSFEDRCNQVETAFRRLGINPDNPSSVLIQRTPSGGRHYYVFFDALYLLYQFYDLLRAAKICHVPGEIEIYPSTKNGLRLPFGYVPGQRHDPTAWIRFIDHFHRGRIIRHSLHACYEALSRHNRVQERRILSIKRSVSNPPDGRTNQDLDSNRPIGRGLGTSKGARRTTIDSNHYLSLLDGFHSPADADELLALGIRIQGTRTKALNLLAAHLVWFRHQSSADAAEFLSEWAMSPRHWSKDIARDLMDGTNIVTKQIQAMCSWYEAHKKPRGQYQSIKKQEFARQELPALHFALAQLNADLRRDQAAFLLHFLRFSKLYGKPAESGTGRDASPAVRQVIRRWPGCHHMNYKTRIGNAIASGCMQVVKNAWHSHSGPGRARTYRILVPVVDQQSCSLDYDDAIAYLLAGEAGLLQGNEISTSEKENCDAKPDGNSSRATTRRFGDEQFSIPVPTSGSRAHLDSGSRQRDSESHEPSGFHRRELEILYADQEIALQPKIMAFGIPKRLRLSKR